MRRTYFYEEDIVEGQEAHRRVLLGWAAGHGINAAYIDAMVLIFPADPVVRNRQKTSGQSLWADSDHVHLAPDAYRDLAAVALEAGVKVESDGAGSIASEDSKRKRRESVVTRLPAMAVKRNKGHASQQRHAAWLKAYKSRGPLRGKMVASKTVKELWRQRLFTPRQMVVEQEDGGSRRRLQEFTTRVISQCKMESKSVFAICYLKCGLMIFFHLPLEGIRYLPMDGFFYFSTQVFFRSKNNNKNTNSVYFFPILFSSPSKLSIRYISTNIFHTKSPYVLGNMVK
jgi:hypothetical protein